MRLLHIDSSAQTTRSVTRQLSSELVQSWVRAHPTTAISYRDLALQPPSPVDERWIAGAFSPPGTLTPELASALRESDELVDELIAADVVVFGMPIYNWTVPATVKAWLDQVIRTGRTFRYTATGPEGLVRGKKVIITAASAGDYSESSPLAFMNHFDPYLKMVFGFMGITDVEIITVAGYDEAARAPGLAEARARFARIAAEGLAAPERVE